MARLLILVIAVLATVAVLTACGGDDTSQTVSETPAPATPVPEPTPAPEPTAVPPTPTTAPEPTSAPEPTAALSPMPTEAAGPTEAAAPTEAAPTEAPATATPQPTATQAPPTTGEMLAAYAAERANGPGAIFVGDPTQLIGPPPHEGLMFQFPAEQYNLLSGAALFGSPELQVPSHMFIYTSDYYQGLIQKANLTSPTELVSAGGDIEIQHVCLDRNLPPCVLLQAYYAPNVARRTNGQVNISVTSLVELAIAGPDTLSQVSSGTLDMVNIFTGYVAGELPALEIQSLWGSALDWETSYLSLTGLAEDVDRIMLEATDGSPVLNRNWFAGTDQWFYSKKPLQSVEDYEGLKIRSNSAAMSDFIRGMGAEDEFTSIAELYTSLDQGVVDAAAYGALLAISARLYETTDHMAGPIIGFGYTNNVINRDIWDSIPQDLQQIMIEEGAKAELEGLRLAPFQNVAALAINQQVGMQIAPFSPEIYAHINSVVFPEYVLPGWLRRLGFPERNAETVAIYNEKVSPFTGLWVNDDGSIKQVPITQGTRAGN